jgi:hypothetical protein
LSSSKEERNKRMRRKEKNEQQFNENNSMIQQQKKRETVVIESDQNTITSFDETNTNTTTLSTYQPGIHSSQINKQTNKHILSSHTFDIWHTHTYLVTQEQKH